MEWRDIDGFNGYQVSDTGMIRKFKNGKEQLLTPWENGNGYKRITFWINGKRTKAYVHRLVAEAFIPNPEKLPQVNHKDESRDNNQVNNLEWCTQKYNLNYGTCKERRLANTDFKSVAKKHQKPIKQLKNGILIAKYESLMSAAIATGLNFKNISSAARGICKRSGGFEWQYV